MTEYPYILFNKSPEQLRHIGACGGRAYRRNRHARRALLPMPPQAPPPTPTETAAQAIHALDAQFSWLRGAEKPTGSKPAGLPCARGGACLRPELKVMSCR
jgi:hypothetical protein